MWAESRCRCGPSPDADVARGDEWLTRRKREPKCVVDRAQPKARPSGIPCLLGYHAAGHMCTDADYRLYATGALRTQPHLRRDSRISAPGPKPESTESTESTESSPATHRRSSIGDPPAEARAAVRRAHLLLQHRQCSAGQPCVSRATRRATVGVSATCCSAGVSQACGRSTACHACSRLLLRRHAGPARCTLGVIEGYSRGTREQPLF